MLAGALFDYIRIKVNKMVIVRKKRYVKSCMTIIHVILEDSLSIGFTSKYRFTVKKSKLVLNDKSMNILMKTINRFLILINTHSDF